MIVGIGLSEQGDSKTAGLEAAQAAAHLSGEAGFALVFTTDRYDPAAVLSGVREALGPTRLAGFCCAGVITAAGVFRDAVGVCAMAESRLGVRTALESGLRGRPRVVGQRIAKELLAEGTRHGLAVVLPDAFGGNLSEMLRGLYNSMGPKFHYVGGGAGDNLKFFKTYQFTDQGVVSDGCAAALLSGVEFGLGLGHGWRPMGDPLVVTKVKEKTVLEMDGIPAYEAYTRRIGSVPRERFAETGMKHPLGFPNVAGQFLIRDPIAVHADLSMDFVTEIPCHAVGNVMEGEVEELIATAGAVAELARRQISRPACALVFDCVSRYLLLGEHFGRELEIIRNKVGLELPVFGALTFGEIGAYNDVPLFHNKTTVVAVVGGRSA